MCLLYCACHAKCIFADPLQMSHACHRFWNCYKTFTSCSLLARCRIPCTCRAKSHLNRTPGVLLILTWKCASRRNGVHFFNISTSKSALNMVRFVQFDLEMCFASQRRALFQHLNFQKCSEPVIFFTLLTSKCASRHNGVHFFHISTSKSGPALVCFVHFDLEICFALQQRAASHLSSGQMAPPTVLASQLFDPPEPQTIGTGSSSFGDFSFWILFLLSAFCFLLSSFFFLLLSSSLFFFFSSPLFSSLLLSSPLFSSLLFSDSSHLCFSSFHIVGSLTSKFPSNISCGRGICWIRWQSEDNAPLCRSGSWPPV